MIHDVTPLEAVKSRINYRLLEVTQLQQKLITRLLECPCDALEAFNLNCSLRHTSFLISHLNQNLEIASAFGLSKLPFCNKK